MCGIVGIVRETEGSVAQDLLGCLHKLSYRGYDSAGLATNDGYIVKSVGEVANLISTVNENRKFTVGISHVRWATHGEATRQNSHPHVSGNVSIVHNGIIANYEELRDELEMNGYVFKTPVDSEVIAHFFNYHMDYGFDIHHTIRAFFQLVKGEFATIIMVKDIPELYVLRRGSPLFAGIGEDQVIVASDVFAFRHITTNVVPFDDDEYAIVDSSGIEFFDKDSNKLSKNVEHLTFSDENEAVNDAYEHFMLKEIEEQPRAVSRLIENSLLNPELKRMAMMFRNYKKIVFLGCGTSYHAGFFAQSILEKYLVPQGYQFYSVIASEFDSFNYVDGDTLIVALSQSGETMDVIKAIKTAKSQGGKVISLVNVPHSTIWRMSSLSIDICAGTEIAVASTKAFTNQVITLLLIAKERGVNIDADLTRIPELITQTIETNIRQVKAISKMLANEEHLIVLGRGSCLPAAKEMALKIEEICYIFTKALMSAELKHGPISLITKEKVDIVKDGQIVRVEKRTPVISLIPSSDAMSSATRHEVTARGANFIAITDTETNESSLVVPSKNEVEFGLGAVVLGQMLSYYTALERGCNVDKPRNLAKSVTVI